MQWYGLIVDIWTKSYENDLDDEEEETTYVTPMLVLNWRERSKPYQKVFGISRCIGKKVKSGYSEHLVTWNVKEYQCV